MTQIHDLLILALGGQHPSFEEVAVHIVSSPNFISNARDSGSEWRVIGSALIVPELT